MVRFDSGPVDYLAYSPLEFRMDYRLNGRPVSLRDYRKAFPLRLNRKSVAKQGNAQAKQDLDDTTVAVKRGASGVFYLKPASSCRRAFFKMCNRLGCEFRETTDSGGHAFVVTGDEAGLCEIRDQNFILRWHYVFSASIGGTAAGGSTADAAAAVKMKQQAQQRANANVAVKALASHPVMGLCTLIADVRDEARQLANVPNELSPR